MKGNGNYTAAYRKQYYGAKFFISEMHQKYPFFDPAEFRHILQISYPIALIEVEAKEKSREDFSVVERTILKLINKQVYDPRIIAYVLGLPESYVQKVYRLFQSNKQVDENGITALGKESLALDAYVKENTTRQIIQVDAFTGSPISISEFIDNEKLLDASDTSRDVPHILPVEKISSDKIVGVVKSNYRKYVDQGDYSLHINVMDIGEVVFKELKYTQAYYLEDLKGGVLMLCNAQGKSVKNKNNKQSWRVNYEKVFN